MARPRKEGMDYFPHDTDAANDEKIEALRALYGNDGYAFYFIMLERIYRTPSFELKVSDAETRQILSRKIAITNEKFDQILLTALKWGCFNQEKYEKDGILTSEGIKKRAQVVVEKRVEMRERYKNKEEVSDAETIPEIKEETPQSKVKKSKVKKSKEKKSNKQDNVADFSSAIKFFSDNFHLMTPFEIEKLRSWDDMEPAVIIEAMKEAVNYNVRKWSYIEGILRNWQKEGLTTIQSLEAYRRNEAPKPEERNPLDVIEEIWRTGGVTDDI